MLNTRCTIIAAIMCFTSAAKAAAPVTKKPADIVNLSQIDPTILVAMMYFSNENFTGRVVNGYKANACYLTQAAAEGLRKAQARLQANGKSSGRNLSLMVRDCYRPQKAVMDFVHWASDPDDVKMKSAYYPELDKNQLIPLNYISPVSGHSRASSVDLTIVEFAADGAIKPLPMGTPVDYFSDRSHTAFAGLSTTEADSRQLLFKVMSPEFKNYSKEWWHYALKVEPYPKTFFDFDIALTNERAPQQTMAAPTTQISEVSLLAELDKNNSSPLSMGGLFKRIHEQRGLAVPPLAAGQRTRASELAKFVASYAVFKEQMTLDLARIIKDLGIDWEKEILKTYDVKSAKTEAGKKRRLNGNVMRVFNEKWLTSADGQFVLAGVVNRMDRRDFDPGLCGELRFIYRMGYEVKMEGKTYASRLPFTVNMVFSYLDDGQNCQALASLWRMDGLGDNPAASMQSLLAGPLDFKKLKFKQMEINAQIARFPSDLENDENRKFAGQAIYWMRIFEFNDKGVFYPKKLENTPDVQGILKDKRQKELEEYLSAHMAEIDIGVFKLPDSLSADLALSFSTAGSARTANRPFDLILSRDRADQLVVNSGVAAANLKFIASGAGLLERLNTSSCMGCHQSSSTAGFHFLGFDRSDFGADPKAVKVALDGNKLQLPFSPHVYGEIARRKHYIERLSLGLPPNRFRPHPSAPAADWARTGSTYTEASDNMPCPLESEKAMASSARWSCNSSRGLSCKALLKNASASAGLGQCVPGQDGIYAGLSCRSNVIEDSTAASAASGKLAGKAWLTYSSGAFNDRVSGEQLIYKIKESKLAESGMDYNCRPTAIGVPLGRVTRPCKAEESMFSAIKPGVMPKEICAIVGGKGFEQMARGYFDSVKFAESVGRGLLNTCTPSHFCREDYICQSMPDLLTGPKFNVSEKTLNLIKNQKIGFCTPTYFVYQLRLDGHPNPL